MKQKATKAEKIKKNLMNEGMMKSTALINPHSTHCLNSVSSSQAFVTSLK